MIVKVNLTHEVLDALNNGYAKTNELHSYFYNKQIDVPDPTLRGIMRKLVNDGLATSRLAPFSTVDAYYSRTTREYYLTPKGLKRLEAHGNGK